MAELSGLLEAIPETQKEMLFVLNPLNIESRYPTYKEGLLKQLDETRCQSILKGTEELIRWTKQQL